MLTLNRFIEILQECKKDFKDREDIIVGISKKGILSFRPIDYNPKATEKAKIIFLDYHND